MTDTDNNKENIENTDVESNDSVAEESSAEEVAEEASAERKLQQKRQLKKLLQKKQKEAPAEEVAEEAAAEETAEEAPAEEAAEEAPVEEISLEEASPSTIISSFETKQLKDDLPSFRPGDTVVVSVKVKEGQRTRLQAFEGVVMGIKNKGLNSSFIVRKISSGIGVERTFQMHSPLIDSIKVKRKGDVRQAKLFYLRERSGKSARIKERLD